jgi:hypothetical protein
VTPSSVSRKLRLVKERYLAKVSGSVLEEADWDLLIEISPKQFAMRSEPRKAQCVCIHFSVDQQQVRFDVALAISGPVTA